MKTRSNKRGYESDLIDYNIKQALLKKAQGNKAKQPAGCNYDNPEAIRIIECGCCGQYHRDAYYGDCRDDSERFADPEDFEARWYGGGYPSVEVFSEQGANQ